MICLLPVICLSRRGVCAGDQMRWDKMTISDDHQNRYRNGELEQRILERTAQLQTAVQELAAFGHSVSHDLCAPLRHLMGFVNRRQKNARPSLSEKGPGHPAIISQSTMRLP